MVSVGLETLPRRMSGRPAMRLSLAVVVSASGGRFADAPGAAPGQTGSVRCPGAGGQPLGWAARVMEDAAKAAIRRSALLLIQEFPRHNSQITRYGRECQAEIL